MTTWLIKNRRVISDRRILLNNCSNIFTIISIRNDRLFEERRFGFDRRQSGFF
ncbi:MAG: hypothetical protein ABII23_08965 [bacterium]